MVKVQQSTVSVLINNTARPDDLIAEHSLSLFIEIDSVRILFDTGQTQALLHNASRMDINLAEIFRLKSRRNLRSMANY